MNVNVNKSYRFVKRRASTLYNAFETIDKTMKSEPTRLGDNESSSCIAKMKPIPNADNKMNPFWRRLDVSPRMKLARTSVKIGIDALIMPASDDVTRSSPSA